MKRILGPEPRGRLIKATLRRRPDRDPAAVALADLILVTASIGSRSANAGDRVATWSMKSPISAAQMTTTRCRLNGARIVRDCAASTRARVTAGCGGLDRNDGLGQRQLASPPEDSLSGTGAATPRIRSCAVHAMPWPRRARGRAFARATAGRGWRLSLPVRRFSTFELNDAAVGLGLDVDLALGLGAAAQDHFGLTCWAISVRTRTVGTIWARW